METVLEKKRKMFIEDYSFKELCDELDKMHEEYISWNMKTYTIEEVWDNIKNRKNTFLTSK